MFSMYSSRLIMELLLNRCSDEIPPLGPRAIVVSNSRIAQQVGENKPGMGRSLADTAVGDHLHVQRDLVLLLIDLPQLLGRPKGAVVWVGSGRPRDVLRVGNVSSPLRSLLRVVHHMKQLT